MAIEELNEIVGQAQGGKLILFLGAGISTLAGCKPHNYIINKLKGVINKLEESTLGLSPEQIISFCKNRLKNDRVFWATLGESLASDLDKLQNIYKPFLKKLSRISPQPPIVTTNIDDNLDFVPWSNHDRKFYEINELAPEELSKGGVFYIHGHKLALKRSIWSETDYKKRYSNTKLTRFLNAVFKNGFTVLFLGYGLHDSLLNTFFLNRGKSEGPTHYLLAPDNEFNDQKKIFYLETYRLKIIEYGKIEDLPSFISTWINSNFGTFSLDETQDMSKANG